MRRLTKVRTAPVMALIPAVVVLCTCWVAQAAPLQLISMPNPGLSPATTGGGDSYLPIVTPDGRFVLFASTAENLAPIGTNGSVPADFPARLNVFLKDRTNGSTLLISVNTAGTGGGNGDSLPTGVSTNGRYVLFESSASNLVAGDTNKVRDVFVRDALAGTTLLVSTSVVGGFGDKPSYSSVITPDGRYVAFASAAANLVSGDSNGIADVFVRDMVNNVTTLVSVGAQTTAALGSQLGSDAPIITPDGRYVAFQSSALKLVPGVSNFAGIYIRDLVNQTTTLASSGALAALQTVVNAANAVCFSHSLSSDARYVAFQAAPYPLSYASPNLVLRYDGQTGNTDLIDTNGVPAPGGLYLDSQNLDMTPDGRFVAYVARANGTLDTTSAVRLWDAQTASSILITHDLTNGAAPGSVSDSPVVDNTGRFVALVSTAANLVTNDLQGAFHVYLADAQSGTITLLDQNTKGAGSGVEPDLTPLLNTQPQFIGFYSQQNDLVPLDNNRSYDVFLRDAATGSTELISTHDPSLPSLAANGTVALSRNSLSWDGRMVAFASDAPDLTGNDTNGLPDVFVRDLTAGTNYLISINTNGSSGDGLSGEAVISADGQVVAFSSYADDLVSGDTNQAKDVFVTALLGGRPVLASVNYAGTGSGNRDSFTPLLSTNGQALLFHSRAGDLSPGMPPFRDNLFWRDLQRNLTYPLTTNGVISSSMTADGRLVALITASYYYAGVSDRLYLWDSQASSIVLSLTGSGAAFSAVALSPDGQRMAYVTNASGVGKVWAVDRALGTNWQVGTFQAASEPGLRFSGDGRFLTYVAYTGPFAQRQVYLYDFETTSNLLVSQSYGGSGNPGNSHSDSPEISSDGRFISYHSEADSLVPGDTNGTPDLFLYDRLDGSTTLLSVSPSGGGRANTSSSSPVFSGDSQTLMFASWAPDLVAGDFNHTSDLFAMILVSSTAIVPFAVSVSAAPGATGGNWLNWSVEAGRAYRVLFKNDLSDSIWQTLNAPISIVGDRASARDNSVSASARFYRIVAY